MPSGVYVRTPKMRRNISISHKGLIPWNKGKPSGVIPWNKGKKLPKDLKDRISKAVLNSPVYQKHRNTITSLTKEEKDIKRREYRLKNADKVAIWKKRDYEKHKDKYIKRSKQHYEDNKEDKKKYSREYQQEHIKYVVERIHIWKKENPEKVRSYSENRRSRKKQCGGYVSADDITTQYNKQDGKCFWCSIQVEDNYHIDHKIPLSKGGLHLPHNIVISCPKCNLTKNNKMPDEFLSTRESASNIEKE
jgi:5-methylcytosine-specific restriction endonuclease McrA